MVGLTQMLFGGAAKGPKQPKEDPELASLQKKQAANEQARADELAAEEAAARRALDSGRVGRSLLTYTPASGAGKTDTLGG